GSMTFAIAKPIWKSMNPPAICTIDMTIYAIKPINSPTAISFTSKTKYGSVISNGSANVAVTIKLKKKAKPMRYGVGIVRYEKKGTVMKKASKRANTNMKVGTNVKSINSIMVYPTN